MAKAKKAEEEKDAPETEGAEGEATAPKKGFLSKKLIIIAAAGLLVLGGGGGGAWFFLFKTEHHEEKPAPVAAKPPAFVDMPEVLVNLSGTGNNGRAQYLKAKIVLEVTDQKIADDIKPVLPRVLDAFQTYLREMRASDLEGSAGLYRVRDELTRRVNLAVAPSRINAVLFREIVVQ
jgi:flagellar FliL protein